MNLYINGKKAVIKYGSSFEYVSENRAFTDSDAYTLAITLPMAGCPQNQKIFGYMSRMDYNTRSVVVDAILTEGNFYKSGVISVVEANECEIKVQFLEGRAVQNFNVDYDQVYINELDLGSYPASLPYRPTYPDYDKGSDYLPFQWVNNTADGFLNNEILSANQLEWAESTINEGKLSYMPYLIFVTKKICEAAGFKYDFSPWEESEDRFLLICNAIPAAWDAPAISHALPHWSFPEYFAQLERFLVCEFDIDYKRKSVTMKYSKDIESLDNIVKIDEIVDDFSSDISYKDSLCKYRAASRIHFADRGDTQWKYDSCDWFIELMEKNASHIMKFKTNEAYENYHHKYLPDYITVSKDGIRGTIRGCLYYIEESDRYFIWRLIPVYTSNGHGEQNEECYYIPQYINQFGDYLQNPDPEESLELKIVPARIDNLSWSQGHAVFLSPAAFNEVEDFDENDIRQPYAYSLLNKQSEGEKSPEYYDKIMVAIWKDNDDHADGPCPAVDKRLSLGERYKYYQKGIMIKPKEKINLKFLSDEIPDVRSIFYIRGKRYLCEKITATFTDDGMSRLMKGEFYPIAD